MEGLHKVICVGTTGLISYNTIVVLLILSFKPFKPVTLFGIISSSAHIDIWERKVLANYNYPEDDVPILNSSVDGIEHIS